MRSMNDTPIPASYCERYLAALLQGDRVKAGEVVTDALQHGVGVASFYLDVIVPAQVEIGERWYRQEIDVAQEHLATEITLEQMRRLRATVPAPRPNGQRAVVAAVEDEQHDLGARVLADFLMMDGWAVDFLGANTPAVDLATFVARRRPQVVVLSVTLPEHLSQAERAITELRKLAEPPPILLGGRAVRERVAVAQAAGADVITTDAWDVVQQARAFITTEGETLPLDRLLRGLGERIREQRRARDWSQQQLGDAAGLDRSYVNAVEQGKQNLTLAAVLRIAAALEVPVDQLLFARDQAGG